MSITREYPELSSSRISEDHDLRSQFVEQLLAEGNASPDIGSLLAIPRQIVQFWDELAQIPDDVQACLDSWALLGEDGYTREIFGDVEARRFITANFEPRHVLAFDRCGHPAMRADFFRLCFILRRGGLYVDADDVFQGVGIEHLFQDSRLKLQPLCYDLESASMLAPAQAITQPHGKRVFYVNNNPLAAPPDHPVIARALERATAALEVGEGGRDVQSLTGPGNLTAALVAQAVEAERGGTAHDFVLLDDWDSIAVSKWPLEYRAGDRNWRNWARSDD